MKKSICLGIVLCLLGILSVKAQAPLPGRVTIKGIIKDTTGNPASFATVMLLSPKDSTLQNYTQTTFEGSFAFKDVKNQPYLLKVSHISFLPLQVALSPSPSAVNDLGIVKIRPILAELMEVVIRTAKAPLMIRGDTIEYDATMFKIPTGSTAEDLLKRLPGIEVDAAGNITTQGKTVDKVYVDGKAFFGDDPQNATKNIEAQAISKVQVFDQKSEQAQLTGVDDGSKEKAMNIELKDEYKKGSFGKITLAGGTQERWAGRGNYNRFNEKYQLSFIGYANNINETGVNWEDYSEFKGQNSFNNYDNGDFGFSSGGRYYYFNESDIPMDDFDGKGFTKNYGAGTNYNYDNKKTKFNVNYFFHHTARDYSEITNTENFLKDSSYRTTDTLDYNSSNFAHSAAMRFEQDIDSSNKIIAKANFRYTTNGEGSLTDRYYTDPGDIIFNLQHRNEKSNGLSWRANATAIYNHKFKKQGRAFALSAGYNRSQGEEDENNLSHNTYYMGLPYSNAIHQQLFNDNDKEQIKASALYSEPLSKKFFLELFYNFNLTNNRVNRQAEAPAIDNMRIDSLSMYYTNKSLANRVGAGLRFSNNGLNVMVGLAGSRLELDGRYSLDQDEPLLTDPLQKTYYSLGPKATLSYEFSNGMWTQFEYGYGLEEPSFDQLKPVTIMNSQNSLTMGNPDLEPEGSHEINANLFYRNPANFASMSIGCWGTFTDNAISYNRIISWVDSVGYVNIYKPFNNGASTRINAWLWSDIPLIRTKLNLRLSGNYYITKSGSYINEDLNTTTSNSYTLRPGFKITPGQKLIIELSGSGTYTKTNFTLGYVTFQEIYSFGGDLDLKWQFLKKTFLESNFDYSRYMNPMQGFNQELPVFNASVRQLLGKKNNFQLRLAAFDILNKKKDISQYASGNYVMQTISPTLARYFMLSVSYSIKGYESKLKKNDRF